jgi:dTDP-4-amino-4,6-dideoxygalactose transaminase
MKVSFLDLKSHHLPHREEFDRAIAEVIDTGAFAGGRFVEQFETEFAVYCDAKYAIAVGSGTDALWLALLALGVGPGDEVITVPNTFIATAEAISYCGATPVFVDVDERSYNMDPEGLKAAITDKTKAIIPVHLFGQMADMDPIIEVANAHGIPVVEDAAQAHGAKNKGRCAGSLGAAGCFSFYPGKNLGAFGEGGAVVTDDEELATKIRMFRDHGQEKKYHHKVIGWNCRMDGIQGAVLSIKLRYLDECNQQRRDRAAQYSEALQSVDEIVLPQTADESEHVHHIYAVRVANRDALLEAMAAAGIGCAIHYPVPVHLQEAYNGLPYAEGAFPIAERCASEFLSLPMFPELTIEQSDRVTSTLKQLLGRKFDL